MNRLPIEIENKIWSLYYSHIHYVNVISELHNRINLCDQIVNNKIRGYSPLISMLEYYSKIFSDVNDKDWVKQRIFQISFYNSMNEYKRL
jgi:hypothetical protein